MHAVMLAMNNEVKDPAIIGMYSKSSMYITPAGRKQRRNPFPLPFVQRCYSKSVLFPLFHSDS